MRWQIKILIVVALGFAALDVAQSQVQPPGGGGFGKGGGGTKNVQTLLEMKAVKDELKLTDDQAKKVDEAVWKSLATVLDAEQFKRLHQIDLQLKDYHAFADAHVQTELKMTVEQKANVKTILEDADKERADVLKELGGGKGGKGKGKGGGGANNEKLKTIDTEAKERVTSVLTKEQKRAYNEMVGEKFEMPAFGKKKKDQ
jgi:hypothetical protein